MDIDKIIKEVAQKLVDCYHNKTSLRFPCYGDGSNRISEQESKFFFSIVFDQQKSPFSFAVEVPTKEKFIFNGKKKSRSALHDMVIYDESKIFKWVIELKSKQAKTIEKDFHKMARAECDCVWFHTLEAEDSGTIRALLQKFKKAWDNKKTKFSGEIEYEWNFAIVVLKSKKFYRKKIKTGKKFGFPNDSHDWECIKLV